MVGETVMSTWIKYWQTWSHWHDFASSHIGLAVPLTTWPWRQPYCCHHYPYHFLYSQLVFCVIITCTLKWNYSTTCCGSHYAWYLTQLSLITRYFSCFVISLCSGDCTCWIHIWPLAELHAVWTEPVPPKSRTVRAVSRAKWHVSFQA